LASNGGALKHEAVRALVEVGMPGGPDAVITLFGSSSLWKPTDPIWVQLISTFQKGVADPNSSALLTMLIPPPKVDVLTKSPQARFQRAQLRASLEQQIDAARPYLADGTVSRFSGGVPLETRALLCLVVPPEEGAAALSRIAPDLERKLLPEEISLLAAELSQPTVRTAFEKILNDPTQRAGALAALEGVPAKAWTPELTSMVVGSMRDLLSHDPTEANRLLLLRLAAGRKLTELEPEIKTILQTKDRSAAESIAAIRALHEIGSADVDLLRPFFTSTNKELQREAITTLASGKSEQAVPIVVGLWPKLPVALRKLAIERLASSKAQGQALVAAVRAGRLPVEDLDGSAIEKLSAVLGDDTELTALLGEIKGALQPVLRLDGGPGDIVETGIDLVGPFTVEAWVKLDAGIGNEDTLLGSLAGPSLNFYDGRLRVFVGGEAHDVIVARTALKPETWTHVAVTRDSAGRFRIYLNGELDVEKESGFSATLTALHIGGNGVGKGTAGWFTEFRAWNVERTAEEIRDAQLQSFASEPLPPQLVRFATGAGPWGTMRGQARVQQVRDFPALLTGEDARLLNEKFAHFRALAEKPGDLVKGQMRFDFNCAVCHVVKGEGGKIGPDLSGAGAMGTESLLRNIITPHIQLESGYYRYDVELTNGDVLSGFLVKEADDAITLRPPGAEERVIPRAEIRKTSVSKRSLMPEGLLESMAPEHVSDLFTYLRSLK
ncbi:MAG TPA: LamG-like jellyroll fold domain-containing protein, partial [Chthoniobacteraceae bacterium]